MLRGMSSKQFVEQQILETLEPFESEMNDIRFGSLIQVIVNMMRDDKKRPLPFTLDECIVWVGDKASAKAKPKQSTKEIEQTLDTWFSAVNAAHGAQPLIVLTDST